MKSITHLPGQISSAIKNHLCWVEFLTSQPQAIPSSTVISLIEALNNKSPNSYSWKIRAGFVADNLNAVPQLKKINNQLNYSWVIEHNGNTVLFLINKELTTFWVNPQSNPESVLSVAKDLTKLLAKPQYY